MHRRARAQACACKGVPMHRRARAHACAGVRVGMTLALVDETDVRDGVSFERVLRMIDAAIDAQRFLRACTEQRPSESPHAVPSTAATRCERKRPRVAHACSLLCRRLVFLFPSSLSLPRLLRLHSALDLSFPNHFPRQPTLSLSPAAFYWCILLLSPSLLPFPYPSYSFPAFLLTLPSPRSPSLWTFLAPMICSSALILPVAHLFSLLFEPSQPSQSPHVAVIPRSAKPRPRHWHCNSKCFLRDDVLVCFRPLRLSFDTAAPIEGAL
eukprot:2801447-Pleurochrysis_carterae.AAC.2